MKIKKYKYLMCDFETTVYDGQEYTEVWAAAAVELYTDTVHIFQSIEELYEHYVNYNCNICAYFHNLKFDGSFWIDYLLTKRHMQQAYTIQGDDLNTIEFDRDEDMKNNTFKYCISNMGQWYSITIKVNNHFIEIRDSLKLLPFSVRRIGKSFKTKHQKLDMEYKGFRYSGCTITDEEKEYIANDVLVVKEALEIMFREGHTQMTIGSCCLSEFKATHYGKEYKELFPDLYEINLPEIYGANTAGSYIRKAYRGGWCYLVEGKENQIKYNGTTADVNSLYPSMMSGDSGNKYPVGKPTFWSGNFIPEEAQNKNKFYFVRFRTRFYIKNNYLPFIQIKHNPYYPSNKNLKTSDIYDENTGKYYKYCRDKNGEIIPTTVELTMTQTDFELTKEHYNFEEFEILDGCYFTAKDAYLLFDDYIGKYKKQKQNSTGARRELAKLFLNNLYGKMAASTDSSFKVAYLKDDNTVGFFIVDANNKRAGYIPIGAAITSYARNFTIRAAQLNYHGVNKRGFIYADTDSIHCDLQPNEIKGITIHDKDFCCWKLESCWDSAIFVRQKTYIEHITHADLEAIENPRYDVKCAGMPDRCKQLFIRALENDYSNYTELSKDAQEFLTDYKGATLKDFKIGLKITGKLLPKRIKGGIVLQETTYEMR